MQSVISEIIAKLLLFFFFFSSITSLEHLNLTLMLRTVIETLEKSVRKI